MKHYIQWPNKIALGQTWLSNLDENTLENSFACARYIQMCDLPNAQRRSFCCTFLAGECLF